MIPNVSIVCQEGGHRAALEYARLVKSINIPVLVNFPNTDGFSIAENPSQLLNERTGALIVILSPDIFPGSKSASKYRIDDVMRHLHERSKAGSASRIFLVLTTAQVKELIRGKWIEKIQYLLDGPITREQILVQLSVLTSLDETAENLSSYEEVKSIIQGLEPGFNITETAHERVTKDKISYQIFECTHKVRKKKNYYIHLHRGVTITNTARHIEQNYPDLFSDASKFVLLPMELGAARPQDRLENIRVALKCEDVEYLEDAVFKLIVDTIDVGVISDTGAVVREFIEPQVRFSSQHPDLGEQTFSAVADWISKQNAGVLVLVGQGGIGKTWAMLNLRQRITENKIQFKKSIQRRVIFITSTDINRGIAAAYLKGGELTIYDLYVSSCAALHGSDSEEWLDKSTFYNAFELGNILIFIDGLDEVISRNRSRFNANHFFSDLNSHFSEASEGKVIISCRNIFFDDDEYRLDYPHVIVADLLAFNEAKRREFFEEAFERFPNRLRKAIALSDQLAKLPDNRYVPFVLSLIRDVVAEEMDGSSATFAPFASAILNPQDQFDRVVGQFCHREIHKVIDPLLNLTVDLQVKVFSAIARMQEGEQVLVHRQAFRGLLKDILGQRDVEAIAVHLETHPFLSQEELKHREIITFRFDFMPEYFAMLDMSQRLVSETISKTDVRLLNKFGGLNSLFCSGIVKRYAGSSDDFKLHLLGLLEGGRELIKKQFSLFDQDFLEADAAISQFSFACVSMLASYHGSASSGSVRDIGNSILELFKDGNSLRDLVVLDGLLPEEKKLKLDFRGLEVENCLFNSMDFFACQFDGRTSFKKCKFSNCTGGFSKASGIHLASFAPDCLFDDAFESVISSANKKISSSAEQVFDSLRSFISDFHKHGGFRRVNRSNLERYYGQSNSAVSFKNIYRVMKRHNVIVEFDKGHYIEVAIASAAAPAAERLITQAVLMEPLGGVAFDLID